MESKSLADSKDIDAMDNEDNHSYDDINNQICRSNLENCDEDFALDNSYDGKHFIALIKKNKVYRSLFYTPRHAQ